MHAEVVADHSRHKVCAPIVLSNERRETFLQ